MPFGSLWIQVIVCAVVVFVVSSILHMVLSYHKADHRPLPNDEVVREALGKGSPSPGVYMTPHCADMKQMKEPAVRAKWEKGPVAVITVHPKGVPAMPKYLALWFGFCLLVTFVVAYVARHTLAPGADGLFVMRVTGTVAFAAYGIAPLSDSIWKGQPWAITARFVLDGAIYALATGLTFRLMWPGA